MQVSAEREREREEERDLADAVTLQLQAVRKGIADDPLIRGWLLYLLRIRCDSRIGLAHRDPRFIPHRESRVSSHVIPRGRMGAFRFGTCRGFSPGSTFQICYQRLLIYSNMVSSMHKSIAITNLSRIASTPSDFKRNARIQKDSLILPAQCANRKSSR